MTSLRDHQSSQFTKLLYLGDHSTGKTGSLISLVKAGYKLRIADWDNGLDVLVGLVKDECPELIDSIDFEPLYDTFKATPTGPKRTPKAWVRFNALMEKWSDGTDPAEWGSDTIFVWDSTTFAGRACLAWAQQQAPDVKDQRQWYWTAQPSFIHMLDCVCAEDFRTNVIVIAHVKYDELADGTTKGYPTAVGSAIGPQIGGNFNTVIQAESKTYGDKKTKRTIRTIPSARVDLKNPVPFRLNAEYPLETGLATIFEELRK